MKKILICEFHQETNTFNPIVWDIDRFGTNRNFESKDRFEYAVNANGAVGGGIKAIVEAGGEAVPSIFMHASSGGRVGDDVLAHFLDRVEHYAKTQEFDGIYAALHGATCTESEDDACGVIAEHLRKLAGDRPVAISCDLHAKITDKMLCNADIITGYQTYPHIDHYKTGYRAAKHLMELLSGKKLVMATVKLPVLVPPAGYTTREEPFKGLMDKALSMIESGKVSDASIFPVQPWLDIPEIMSRIVVIGEDAEAAKACAAELAQGLFDIKDRMWPKMYSIDEVIDIAEANKTGKPVLLADSADSPNGGCVGDSPAVAMRVLERGSKLRTGVFIVDPTAVARAFELGVGTTAEFSVGAGYTKGMPGPLKAEGYVRSLHDGWFRLVGKSGRGSAVNIGKVAVVVFDTVYVVLAERCAASGDPGLLRGFGVDPELCDLVVVKANTSFREPYSYISDLVYVGDTPGAGASNLQAMPWDKMPMDIYPFGLPETYEIEAPELW